MKKKIKIILLEDLPHIGRKYEVHEVAIGYFRNFLFPKRFAKIATDKILEQLKDKREQAEKAREKRVVINKEKAEKIKDTTYIFERKASEKGHIYGSVSAEDILEKIKENGYEDAQINLTHPLKSLGEEQVWVDFGDGIRATINVIVQKEGFSTNSEKTKKEDKKEEKPEEKKEIVEEEKPESEEEKKEDTKEKVEEEEAKEKEESEEEKVEESKEDK